MGHRPGRRRGPRVLPRRLRKGLAILQEETWVWCEGESRRDSEKVSRIVDDRICPSQDRANVFHDFQRTVWQVRLYEHCSRTAVEEVKGDRMPICECP